MKHFIKKDEDGSRLDILCTALNSDKKRSYIKKLIDSGYIKVNGMVRKAGYLVHENEVVEIKFPTIKKLDMKPSGRRLNVVYEDADIIVIDKPPNMVVHAGAGMSHADDSLVNALMGHCKDLQAINDTIRPGIVHRLDKDTSGLIVVAKNEKSNRYLLDSFKNRSVKKTYMALVCGHIKPASGIIDSPIGRSRKDRKKMSVTADNSSREAITNYSVMEYINGYSLLSVSPKTGRTHQIRVHLSAIGFPIAGDDAYGNKKLNNQLKKRCNLMRQFLHASELEFVHPVTQKNMNFKSNLPDDLERTMAELRGN